MSAHDLRRKLPIAMKRVSARVSGLARRDLNSRYDGGLASEGYMAGYLAALRDVEVMLNAGVPGSGTHADLWD